MSGAPIIAMLALLIGSSPALAGQSRSPEQSRGMAEDAYSELPEAPSSGVADPMIDEQRRSSPHELLAGDPYVPLSSHEKFKNFLHHTYAVDTFVSAGFNTTFSRITGDGHYCCAAQAWGKQFGATLADTEVRSFFGTFLFPTLLHQDPRYLPKRKGTILGRIWYAATRVAVTRNDSGRNVFNSSELLGVAFSKAMGNAYYPEHERTWSGTGNRILGSLEGDASGYVIQEFLPDLKRLFKRHAPEKIQEIGRRMPYAGKGGQ